MLSKPLIYLRGGKLIPGCFPCAGRRSIDDDQSLGSISEEVS